MCIRDRGIYFVEKYQEVNRIVEEILKHVGGEVRDLTSEGSLICLLYTSFELSNIKSDTEFYIVFEGNGYSFSGHVK